MPHLFTSPLTQVLAYVLAGVLIVTQMLIASAENRINLAGEWHLILDRNDRFKPSEAIDLTSSHSTHLPGSLDENGLGDIVDANTTWIASQPQGARASWFKDYLGPNRFHVPFWLRPNRRYLGRAWYWREIEIPEGWQHRSVELYLERPHWQTEVYVGQQKVGASNSLSVPHRFDVSNHLRHGKQILWISVDNRITNMDIGINSHSVSDHTQSAWHGIIGRLELVARPAVSIQSVRVHPDASGKDLRVECTINNKGNLPFNDTCTLLVQQNDQIVVRKTFKFNIEEGETKQTWHIPLDQAVKRWDEFEPNLCGLEVILGEVSNPIHRFQTKFGIRTVRTEQRQIYINERAVFLRGTVECCVFPLTGYPPTDIEAWRKIFARCKEVGLNHMRFHSWCPPEAAFDAADEAGIYLQIECSTWPNSTTSLGVGKDVDEWLVTETERILSEYGNHPSFLMLASGNEPAGGKSRDSFLSKWLQRFKPMDDQRLMTSAAGWPTLEQSEFHITQEPRLQPSFDGTRTRVNSLPPSTMPDYRVIVQKYKAPLIAHESGQWCVFPDFEQAEKYTGNLRPSNLEIYQELLGKAGLLEQAHAFMMDSGQLQFRIYKEEMETALRTPELGGFQLLDIRDFPGQGNAVIGMLDPFWSPKPYVSCERIRRFCGPIVPLARFKQRVWTDDETLAAEIQVAQFGPRNLRHAQTRWRLQSEHGVVANGELPRQDVPTGGLRLLGKLEYPFQKVDEPTHLQLVVEIEADGVSVENDWSVWVYPASVQEFDEPKEQIVHYLSDQTVRELEAGKSVLLMVKSGMVATDVTLGFTPIFWNSVWTNRQPPHTLGLHCNPKHPALTNFETDSHSDWQWWELIHRAAAMDLSRMPTELKPIVQVIPDWNAPKRLGLLFEVRVGKGKLLVCSMDLRNQLTQRPVARQMLASLRNYMRSERFQPQVEVSVEDILKLLRPRSNLQRLQASISADSEHADYTADKLMDGDMDTIWHTPYGRSAIPFPHFITIDLKAKYPVRGMKCSPRREEENGRIRAYQILVSDDGETWAEAASGTWANDGEEKVVTWGSSLEKRYVRLVAESDFKSHAISCLAEVDVLLDSDSDPNR